MLAIIFSSLLPHLALHPSLHLLSVSPHPSWALCAVQIKTASLCLLSSACYTLYTHKSTEIHANMHTVKEWQRNNYITPLTNNTQIQRHWWTLIYLFTVCGHCVLPYTETHTHVDKNTHWLTLKFKACG